MKVILAILGGLSLSVIAFVGGLVAATVYFSAGEDKKQLADATDLWTNHPVRVDLASTDLERLPSRAPSPAQPEVAGTVQSDREGDQEIAMTRSEEEASSELVAQSVDDTVTGSIPSSDETAAANAAGEPLLSEAHLEWCSSRYRSYRPRDNSFTPYSGGRRQCESPFSAEMASNSPQQEDVSPPPTDEDSFAEDDAYPKDSGVEQAAAGHVSGYGTAEHAASCFARYRSYRPEDNTYQPFGGGPRQQCE